MFTFFGISLVLFNAGLALAANPVVTVTGKGNLLGTTTILANNPTVTVNKFLGVPYAANPPPMFSTAATPTPWVSTLTVESFGSACYQKQATGTPTPVVGNRDLLGWYNHDIAHVYNNPPNNLPLPPSSSCLFVNVFAPQNPTKLLPVIFWIHGGSLQTGSSSFQWYDGASFAANQDVVVVTINYRLNVFGWSSAPGLTNATENNVGFYDQRLALQWVYDNIEPFGGDPEQITIMGESSGATSVAQLLFLRPPVPFVGAIMQSFAVNQNNGVGKNSSGEWAKLVTAFPACANFNTDATQLKCIQGLNPQDIENMVISRNLTFLPNVDDVTCVNSIKDSPVAPRKVPVLLGTNANEGQVFFTTFADAAGPNQAGLIAAPNTSAIAAAALSSLFPGYDGSTSVASELVADIVSDETAFLSDGLQIASQIATDILMTCVARAWARYLGPQGLGWPVWRYKFNQLFTDTSAGLSNPGVYHASEIPIVFGTYTSPGDQGEGSLSNVMQTFWASFAKSASSSGGPGSAWTPWSNTGKNLNIFSVNSAGTGVGTMTAAYDALLGGTDANCAIPGYNSIAHQLFGPNL